MQQSSVWMTRLQTAFDTENPTDELVERIETKLVEEWLRLQAKRALDIASLISQKWQIGRNL